MFLETSLEPFKEVICTFISKKMIKSLISEGTANPSAENRSEADIKTSHHLIPVSLRVAKIRQKHSFDPRAEGGGEEIQAIPINGRVYE